jgi:hypothetical protein
MRLAERMFTDADQQRFASASGDHNPKNLWMKFTLATTRVLYFGMQVKTVATGCGRS